MSVLLFVLGALVGALKGWERAQRRLRAPHRRSKAAVRAQYLAGYALLLGVPLAVVGMGLDGLIALYLWFWHLIT